MNIENMLKQLKEILPAENFKIQPAAAREELLQLERDYNINTSIFIQDTSLSMSVPEEVREKWIDILDTFINFNGSIEDINHLSPCESSYNNKPFIKQNPEENPINEYLKNSKDSDWIPCLFLIMNNFFNFHSIFGMEQDSRIRTYNIYS
jgi:hypothetical protein